MNIGKIYKKKKNSLNSTQVIAGGFFLMILIGTFLLMLPISSKAMQWTDPLTALFTATSASCVTGLVVVDTYCYWSLFGKSVILCMIQIGGLGFITLGVFAAMFFRRNIGLKERNLIQDSVNTFHIGGVVALVRKIIVGTMMIEFIGAMLLSMKFIKEFPLMKAVGYGVFHSISAFCNAGFDLMGYQTPYNSLCAYAADPLVNIVITTLVIIGGIGFVVWDDLIKHKWHVSRYLLHTKIVLVTTGILLVGGMLLFLLFERNNLFAGVPLETRLLEAMFASMTPRTAGFNSVDLAAMTDSSKLLTIFLMFIGGSPGSTAGGVKTTTIAVIFIFIFSSLRNNTGNNVFNRRLEEGAVKKASLVVFINLILALLVALVISATQNLPMMDIMIEVFSAIGTVGMSTGVTRELAPLSRLLIILLMYCGRIGSMTFAIFFIQKRYTAPVQLPAEKVLIG